MRKEKEKDFGQKKKGFKRRKVSGERMGQQMEFADFVKITEIF